MCFEVFEEYLPPRRGDTQKRSVAITTDSLRLKWRRTWEDRPRDFSADGDDGEPVGRIYHMIGVGDIPPTWFWSCYGRHRGRIANANGRELSKDETARALEAAWFEAVERIDRRPKL